MEKLFGQHGRAENHNSDTLEHEVNNGAPASPAQPKPERVFTPTDDESLPNTSTRRNFIKRAGFATLAAIATGSIPSPAKAETPTVNEAVVKESLLGKEKEDALLSKLGLHRNEVKPEFLNKYFEGKYEAIVIINVDPEKQYMNAYDKSGTTILLKGKEGKLMRDVEICSGRKGLETPTGSYESGDRKIDYVNKDKVLMPYSIPINKDQGLYMHQGTITGFPASHGCVRLYKETAEQLFNLAKEDKSLLIVIRDF